MTETQVVDVRTIPPAERQPLYYQFKFEREGQFTWEAVEEGPHDWRVRIGRSAA